MAQPIQDIPIPAAIPTSEATAAVPMQRVRPMTSHQWMKDRGRCFRPGPEDNKVDRLSDHAIDVENPADSVADRMSRSD